METGRAGWSEPSLSKSEGSSYCAQRIYQKVNSKNVSLNESSGTRTRKNLVINRFKLAVVHIDG